MAQVITKHVYVSISPYVNKLNIYIWRVHTSALSHTLLIQRHLHLSSFMKTANSKKREREKKVKKGFQWRPFRVGLWQIILLSDRLSERSIHQRWLWLSCLLLTSGISDYHRDLFLSWWVLHSLEFGTKRPIRTTTTTHMMKYQKIKLINHNYY